MWMDSMDDQLEAAYEARPWRQYVLAPSLEVLRLRSLVVRGRARARGVVSGPTPRPIAWLLAPRTPPEIVWNVLAYWNPRHE